MIDEITDLNPPIKGLKFKTNYFCEIKKPIIIDNVSEQLQDLIIILNHIKFPSDNIQLINNIITKYSASATCITTSVSAIKFDNKTVTSIQDDITKAIKHELCYDDHINYIEKIKYIGYLKKSLKKKIDLISLDDIIKNQIDNLIESIITEFKKGYSDNDLDIPLIDNEILDYIYTELNNEFIKLKKSNV